MMRVCSACGRASCDPLPHLDRRTFRCSGCGRQSPLATTTPERDIRKQWASWAPSTKRGGDAGVFIPCPYCGEPCCGCDGSATAIAAGVVHMVCDGEARRDFTSERRRRVNVDGDDTIERIETGAEIERVVPTPERCAALRARARARRLWTTVGRLRRAGVTDVVVVGLALAAAGGVRAPAKHPTGYRSNVHAHQMRRHYAATWAQWRSIRDNGRWLGGRP
jgi:hypothetical protein